MLRKVHAAHAASGMKMMHDAEQRYDRHSAMRVARELDEMGFAWLEAPLPDNDLQGYRQLRAAFGLPIISGGNDIVQLLQVGDALRASHGTRSGLTSRSPAGSRRAASSPRSPRRGVCGPSCKVGAPP